MVLHCFRDPEVVLERRGKWDNKVLREEKDYPEFLVLLAILGKKDERENLLVHVDFQIISTYLIYKLIHLHV